VGRTVIGRAKGRHLRFEAKMERKHTKATKLRKCFFKYIFWPGSRAFSLPLGVPGGHLPDAIRSVVLSNLARKKQSSRHAAFCRINRIAFNSNSLQSLRHYY
jgi:hypothetical protein